MILAFADYQARAMETAAPANEAVDRIIASLGSVDVAIQPAVERIRLLLRLSYSQAGLSNEPGEFAGKYKKLIRDQDGNLDPEFLDSMVGELGDVLWYLADACSTLGVSLADVAQANLNKLADRKARGVLKGSGDKR